MACYIGHSALRRFAMGEPLAGVVVASDPGR
jgi:hypothetical protein